MGSSAIQLFGRKKCRVTQKAERFFRDRSVSYQFIDLDRKPMSPGELTSVVQKLGAETLIDTGSPVYQRRGMQYMDFDPAEELAEHPGIMRTPVVRRGSDAVVGDEPDGWARVAGLR